MRKNQLITAFLFILGLVSCDQNSFADDLVQSSQPKNLSYMEVTGAREGKSVRTNPPSVDTGGALPVYELVSITKADGTVLDDSYTQFVSIGETTSKTVEVVDNAGNVISTKTTYDSSQNGIITVAEGNNFTNGDYYFTIRVTTNVNGEVKSAVFEKAFHLNVGPLLPSVLIYSPKNQNLVVGAGSKTTVPIVPNANPAIQFELGSHTDKLVIDTQTGVISLSPSYQYTAQETLSPIVKVINTISNESVPFVNVVNLIVSNTPVSVPLSSILFFYPTLKTTGSFPAGGDGFGVQTVVKGNGEDIWGELDNSAGRAFVAPSERPVTNTAQTILEVQTNSGSITDPTTSWMVATTQDLTPFQYGFKLSFTYHYMPAFQIYMADGRTPVDLEVYVSTDYKGGNIQDANGKWLNGTWTKVNNLMKCQRSEGTSGSNSTGAPWGTQFIGTPYPGDQKGLDPDGRKNPSTTFYNKWVRCTYDIPTSQISKNFTVAFKVASYFQGSLLNNAATVPGRGGSFYFSDLYFKASE
jgi:hypothetical protein